MPGIREALLALFKIKPHEWADYVAKDAADVSETGNDCHIHILLHSAWCIAIAHTAVIVKTVIVLESRLITECALHILRAYDHARYRKSETACIYLSYPPLVHYSQTSLCLPARHSWYRCCCHSLFHGCSAYRNKYH